MTSLWPVEHEFNSSNNLNTNDNGRDCSRLESGGYQ